MFITKSIFVVMRFLQEVRIEMKKVNWLSRKEALRLTAIVIIISVVTAIYLGAVDYLLNFLVGTFVF
ncbi:MAG: preprotein translocase subunit SecE [Candidatus Spechtbacteria bacterium RIFCSPLOWO2_01_FULL_46_10]|uniref:Preprotein translocase subunit SecE n=1 Tax=Candidatus Spechtbacteria bacterium RIFCSPLOWO2_01_FULL_46_10 TaxID=1802163 RepID=A0A1G2HER3_9BACT|nr:MAG: preprotein translocase subunit SecE [Candidatus Spechtbacteria bacterium RIFCSPLOWO2_01_FULL_46_10]